MNEKLIFVFGILVTAIVLGGLQMVALHLAGTPIGVLVSGLIAIIATIVFTLGLVATVCIFVVFGINLCSKGA